ncbi:MAG: hypothetical protein JWQ38_1730 [Flavipsychrobacter sp.]|nr:hypothetical protein [Flavipsychrobacter sp.]
MMRSVVFAVPFFFCAFTAGAQNSRVYSTLDTARAYAYYDSSWHYGMNSARHQLYLDSALMVMPTSAYFWQQKSMPLYKQGKWLLGRPFLDSAVKYDPHRWLDYRAFMTCIFERNYRDALADLYKVKVMPHNNTSVMDHPYNFYIGLCHLQLNDFDSSLYYFKDCVDEELKAHGEKWVHYNHLYYLGIAYYEKLDYTAALNCFERALKLYDKFCDAKYYKAICLYKTNRKQEAATVMEEAYANFKDGYGMNEDNAVYERYPYQLRKGAYAEAVEGFKKMAEKTN